MIDVLFEQRVIQNPGLAAEAIWQAANETYNAKARTEGMPFIVTFLILPLTFHRRTATELASKTQPGALYKALLQDREITAGLQARMKAMAARTLQALSIGFQTHLFQMDSDRLRQILPARKTQPVNHTSEEVKTIMNAAKRVGQSFAEMSIAQLITTLGIRF